MTVNQVLVILEEPVFARVCPANRKLMFAGLCFSLYGADVPSCLHCETLTDAYRRLADAVGGKPLTLRGYRDEFDVKCSATRVGFPDKELRATHCRIIDAFGKLTLAEYATLIRGVFGL